MKSYILGGCAMALAMVGAAQAQSRPPEASYIQLNLGSGLTGALQANGHDVVLGPVAVKETLKSGGMASLLYGRRLGDGPLTLEGEGLYLNNAIGSPDLDAALGASTGLRAQTYGGAANLKIEAPVSGSATLKVSPYAAIGVGYGHQDLTILGDHYTGDGFLWQGKVGVALHASGPLTWDFGFRYLSEPTFDTNKLGLAARLKTDVEAVSVGVRWAIG